MIVLSLKCTNYPDEMRKIQTLLLTANIDNSTAEKLTFYALIFFMAFMAAYQSKAL
jgi:hypothetical protein